MIKTRRMRWAGHVARMGDNRNPYGILAGKPEGRRPLGRPRCMWVDNIKMDLGEIGWDGMVWTGSIWVRIGTSEHSNKFLGSIKCWEILQYLQNLQLLKKGSALYIHT
jgi:hypothetical protein